MSLRFKLYSSYVLILTVWLSSGVYFTVKVNETGKILESIAPLEFRKIRMVKSLTASLRQQEETSLLLSRPVTYNAKQADVLKSARSEFVATLDSLRLMTEAGRNLMASVEMSRIEKSLMWLLIKSGLTEDIIATEPIYDIEWRQFETIRHRHDSLQATQKKLANHAAGRSWPRAEQTYKHSVEPLTDSLSYALQNAVDLIIYNAQLKIQFLRQLTALIKALSYTIWSVTLVFLIALVFIDFHRILKGFTRIRAATAKIAKGDFETRIRPDSFSEMNELSESFNTMAEQLQELEKVKMDFFNKLVHDFKSPLDNIKQSADVLLAGMAGATLTDKQREFLEIIKRSATGLRQFVQDQLDESKLITGQTELKYEMTDLKALITERIQLLKPLASVKKIHFAIKSTPTPFQISCDKTKISRVVDNLLNNAIKYTAAHTTVEIELEEFPEMIEVRIRDQGPGIPETQQERIFQKYVRLSTAKGMPGTGLGLYTARYIIQLHGGAIRVNSRPNEGAVFIFSLPKH